MISPSVGDWLEPTQGDLNNPIYDVNNGLLSLSAWRFKWYRENNTIVGETSRRYQVQAADVGSRLRCDVQIQDQWFRYADGWITGPWTEVVT